ncbi:hypothetical protein ACOSP7_007036 [Xanthoceras sorbifolium]
MSYSKCEFIFVSSSDEEKSDNEVGDEATSNFSQPLSSDDKEYVPRADVDIHQTTGPDPPYEDTDKCLNNWIDKFRGQPVLTMFENIHRKMMKRMHKKLQDVAKWGSGLSPLVAKKVALIQDKGKFAQVMCASDVEYEVKDGNNYYIVKLDVKTCDCGYWAVSGIPCKHVMVVLIATRRQGDEYVHHYLIKEAYVKTYSNIIHLIPDESSWPVMTFSKVLSPEKKKMPG